jgi:putative Mn2+ efflux pump MntP
MALLTAAIATSIDALAAGITLPTLDFPPLPAASMIAVVTFFLSAVGVWLGRRAGDRFGRPAEIAGGVILIALGVKILLEHTGII